MRAYFSSSFLCSLLLSLAVAAHGQSCTSATCNAASPNESDVLAALPSTNNTNATVVVNIPSGTASWSSQLTYDIPSAVTNLTIQGNTTINCTGTAGTSSYSCSAIDTTIIKDAATNNDHLWQITTGSSSTHFRMTGLTLEGGNIGSASYPKNNGIVNFAGGSQNFRLDHSHFNDTTYTPSVYGAMAQFNGTIEGVLDHNVLDLGGQGSVANGFQSFTTIGDNVGNGDGTWASATGWGTTAFLFMESNQVNGGYGNDCFWASRMTVRYNTFNNYTVAAQGHPTKTPAGAGRGCRALEIYKNYLNGSNSTPQDAAFGAPIGSALIWGNTFAGGAYRFWAAGTYRNTTGQADTATPNGWGYCGTETSGNGIGSKWDGNSSSTTGYPCLDAIGRGQTQQVLNGANFPSRLNSSTGSITWPQQEFEPVYLFDNSILSSATTFDAYAQLRDNSSQLDRDAVYDCGTFPNGISNPDCPSGFNGSIGAGSGTLATRPSTCTSGPGGTYFTSPTGSYGVAYWATDANSGSGELYVCTSTNNWTPVYQPYTYPHPLVSGTSTGGNTPPSAPTGLVATVN